MLYTNQLQTSIIKMGESLTPMLKQYHRIKSEIRDEDTILFFRLGDFYEMFFEDALQASKILDITLTARNKDDPSPVPLCGVPYHAADRYIAKLLENGKKVAICEQVEDPKLAKGVVKREIVRIITPGVVLDHTLDSKRNNYLAAVSYSDSSFSLAIADVSTGEFRVTELKGLKQLEDEIVKIEPREVLIPRSLKEDALFRDLEDIFQGITITALDDLQFNPSQAEWIKGSDAASNLSPTALSAASAIRNYLRYTRLEGFDGLKELTPYSVQNFMVVDEATKRNLELTETIVEKSRYGSLLWLLDNTHTSMGARLLKQWISYPLMDICEIDARLTAIETLKEDVKVRALLVEKLKGVNDMERLTARIMSGCADARDVIALRDSLKQLPDIKAILGSYDGLLKLLFNLIDPCEELVEIIKKTLVDDPPASVSEGFIIRDGVSDELDELRHISKSRREYIAGLENKERERTGIGSLKIRYNKVFGYYIEVTNTHKDKVPKDYIRKQTLSNAERFITLELKRYEEEILGADEKIKAIEYDIFLNLRQRLARESDRLRKTASAIAKLDVLLSLSIVADKYRYSRPRLKEDTVINIKEGRHPIIERLNPTERFVPNDILVDTDENRILVITGPNMAGKSTVMRQTALIVLLAQIGSFVPAEEAEIGIVDRIFTRVGAADNLMRGQSTFMVEMMETANILKNATNRSLIVIDEIGRGTSTFDGLSIAWAVAEYIHDHIKARTLFATHYHELVDLAETKVGVKNFNIAVREWNNQVIFLRKLVPGGVNRSYGIQVAKLAGLPSEILDRAREVLENLEKGELDDVGAPVIARSKGGDNGAAKGQLHLFSRNPPNKVFEMLKDIDVTVVTPIEALNILHKIKQEIA